MFTVGRDLIKGLRRASLPSQDLSLLLGADFMLYRSEVKYTVIFIQLHLA